MMDEASPPPLMGRLLIDSLRHQVATLTKERDGARLVARQMQERVEQALGLIATLTEALKPFAALVHCDGVEAPYPEEWWSPKLIAAQATLAAVREPIVYVRCSCDHPGDNPACEIDHDQIQHERET